MALESIDTVLAKKDSFSHMWRLMNPDPRFRDQYVPCMQIWNKWPHRAQQRMYWYIRKMLRRGERIYDNPLYNLIYITPHPDNCNGRRDLDEILKNLDARGYDVDIRLKSIQPLSLDKISSEVKVIATVEDKGITITSDGLAKNADGTIVATGVLVDDNHQVVASDGTVIFTAEETQIVE